MVLPQIIDHVPSSFGTYHEPFLGGGSLFFLLQPRRAILNDVSEELIATYEAVRRDADGVLAAARDIPFTKESYYDVRANRSADDIRRAGEFIFLNRACFNGLYRVNSSGKFNVPWGAPKSDFVGDEKNLRACQTLLGRRNVQLLTGDFESALSHCGNGDLVFLDPPYVTLHNRNGFIDYNKRLFSWADQIRLASGAERLRVKGATVLVANALHDDVVSLYPKFQLHRLRRQSTLAGSASRRVTTGEALLVGKP